MKFLMNLILIYCLLITSVFAQSVNPNDQLKLGKPSSVSDKGIVFDTNDGVSNKKLLIEKISKKLKFDGNTFQIGDGSSSSDKELIIAGALKSLKYNGTSGEFEFNDDVKLSGALKADFLQAVNTEVAINSLLRATQGIKVGSGANTIRVSGGNLEFSNDGTLFKKFGTGTGGSSTGTTILDNASFEDGISTNWTSSGGTFTQGTYTNGVEGNTKYAQFVATGAGQYFETALFSLPTNFSGGCQADFKKVNVSTNDLFKVEVLDSSANVLSTGNVKASSWVKFPTINFTCPTSGTQIKLRVTSLSAGTIQVDDAYLGSNQSLVYVSQAKLIGSIKYAATANCSWTTASTSLANFSADTDCPTPSVSGSAIAPATKIPAITFATLPAGVYYFVATNKFNFNTTTILAEGYARFSDGTNTSSIQAVASAFNGDSNNMSVTGVLAGKFEYATTQTNVTFNLQGKTSNASNMLNVSTVDNDLEIQVYYYPSSSDVAVSPEQASWFIDASIGGETVSMGTTALSSYTEITGTTLDLVNNSSKGSSNVEIACSSGTSSSGLTCGASSESLGIAFSPPYSGLYEACFSFGHYLNTTSGASAYVTFQLVETPNNSTTIIQEGGDRVESGINSGVGIDVRHPRKVCGTFNFSDTSKRTIRLMREQSFSGTVTANAVNINRLAIGGQYDMNVTVRPILSAFNRPILTGDQITSPNATRPVHYSASCSTGGVISNAIGSGWASSCTFGSAGVSSIVIPAGKFLSTPNCFPVVEDNGSNAYGAKYDRVNSTATLVRVITINTSTGNATTLPYSISCDGILP